MVGIVTGEGELSGGNHPWWEMSEGKRDNCQEQWPWVGIVSGTIVQGGNCPVGQFYKRELS